MKVREISLGQFKKIGMQPGALSQTGDQAMNFLENLQPGKPILIENASRGLQASLTRRTKKDKSVEMRVDRTSKTRRIALLRKT